jgi:hypothetical protein
MGIRFKLGCHKVAGNCVFGFTSAHLRASQFTFQIINHKLSPRSLAI